MNSIITSRFNKYISGIREQVFFFIPLAMTSVIMVITHSLFNAGLARLPSPEIYLSAFAVAKSMIFIIQSPLIMIRQTVSALVNNLDSYNMVKKFIIKLTVFIVLLLGVISFTDIDRWIFKNIMGLNGPTLDESVRILKVLIIFPAIVTVRSFIQGIMIKFRKTPIVTLATIMRIIFVSAMVLFIGKLYFIPGAIIAGIMFLGALAVEGGVIYLGARVSIGKIKERVKTLRERNSLTITNRVIYSFFWPLLITSLIKALARPIINMGLARTVDPELALSTYAVAWSLGMIFLSPFLMFHQVPLNFIRIGDSESVRNVKIFALISGLIASGLFAIVSFSNAGYYIIRFYIGATEEISLLSIDVLKSMVILPLIIVGREFYWGLLMKKHMTKYVGRGKIINLVSLTITIFFMNRINPLNPAIIGIVGMITGQGMEFIYLYLLNYKIGFSSSRVVEDVRS